MRIRLPIVLLLMALVAASCGSDGSTSDATEAPATTAAPTTSAPTTTAPTTTAGPAGLVPGEDPDVDAIVEVFTIVFDSTTTFDEKQPHIEDPTGLEETVDTYTSTGEIVGGVTVGVTSVTVTGDAAGVIYTLQFNGNPSYPDQEGSAVRTSAGWQVTRTFFCELMASARSACPAP